MSKDLRNYNIYLLIDKSGSMTKSGHHNLTRWQEAQETTLALAFKAAQFDSDGITVIPFARSFQVYDGVTAEKVTQIFTEHEPNGGTATDLVLSHVFNAYATAKAAGTAKPIIVVVVTDGQPDDAEAVKKVIRDFAATLADNGEGDTDEAGILFLQVGNDAQATAFLRDLDDNLNAKFDIVDTKTVDQLEGMTLTDALLAALDG